MRTGLFAGYPDDYAGLGYPIAICTALSIIGLAVLRYLRPRIQIA
jgi:ABC-type polysaccharide/polyol phosphate export permease